MREKRLDVQELQPCDVLLCRGKGLFSDMIVLLDGGTYSHAAVYAFVLTDALR